MKRSILWFVAAAAPAWCAPDAAELLAKARQALGKTEVKTLVAAGAHRVSMKQPGAGEAQVSARDLTLSVMLPSKFLKEETLESPMGGAGPVLVEGFDGEKAWNDTRQAPGAMIFMRMGGPNATPESNARRMQEMFARYLLAMTLSTQPDFPVTFTYAGQAEAPDGKADVLDGKGPGEFAVRLFLDSSSHLPLMLTYRAPEQRIMMNRTMGPGGPRPDPAKIEADAAKMPAPALVEYQVRPAEFRKVGGRMLPHVITWTVNGALAEEIEVKKYTVNGSLSPDIFRKK